MIIYTLGFAFSKDLSRLLLLKKNHPGWQSGLLNGIGGKVNSDSLSASSIELQAKNQLGIKLINWKRVAWIEKLKKTTLNDYSYIIHIFAIASDKIFEAKSDTEVIHRVAPMHPIWFEEKVVPDLRYLIPMSINILSGVDKTLQVIQR